MKSLVHEKDTLLWAEEQAGLLRAGRLGELDYEHILEELEDMGREQWVALQSLLRQIMIYLLKLRCSPAQAPLGEWVDEIVEFRAQTQTRLDETPSLKHDADGLFEKAWQQVRRRALKSFEAYGEVVDIPEVCPYSLQECLDTDFVPKGR